MIVLPVTASCPHYALASLGVIPVRLGYMRPPAALLYRVRLAGLIAGLSMASGCMLIGYDGQAPDPRRDGGLMFVPGNDASVTRPDASLGGAEPDGGADAAPHEDGPAEAGVHSDASTHEPDASTHEPDASTHEPDASTGEPDASTGEPDASTGEPDASTGDPDPDGPWWEDVPLSSPCAAGAAICSQQCTAAKSPCHFSCSKTYCNQGCDKGTQCRAECNGTNCGFECRANAVCSTACSGFGCNISCAAGSDCDHDCRAATGCSLSCQPGAKCLLRHGASLTASMTCSVPAKTCPGNIVVCNRDCPAP